MKFDIAPFVSFLMLAAAVCLIIWAGYQSSLIEPEDIGSFFGKIANGFQRELKP